MLTRIPIRSKLALALVLPVLAVFAVSIYEVGEASTEVAQVRKDTDLAAVALGPGSLIAALQNERNDTATTVVGLREALDLKTEDLAATQRDTDVALKAFRDAVDRSGSEVGEVYASPLAELDSSLTALRKRSAAFTGKPSFDQMPLSNQQWTGYSSVIDNLQAANTRLSLRVEDPELRSAAEMLDALSRQVESVAVMVRTGLISSLSKVQVEGTTKDDVLASISRFENDVDRIDLFGAGSYAEDARNFDKNPGWKKTTDLLRGYLAGKTIDPTAVINAAGDEGDDPNVVTSESLTADTSAALEARSKDLLDAAESRRTTFIGLALLVLIAGGAFMIIAARSITRPLLSLTKQADDMAAHRLPSAVQQILDTPLGEDVVIPDVTPVEVKTRDEVQDVAAALNAVQSSALDLAVEQAVLRRNIADSFVNLGRRTQNLIGRQLDFITELERNETDPATLNNLFKLDHLATRARRNAESLVVLAGLVTPRTWTAPIAMGDVIRAALGEVEDYQRVEVRPIGDAMVPGATASDLVHLLAELLENGLSFSPPGRPVEVHGRMTKNGYVLAVVDQGIGMTVEELASANERLAGRESYTVAPSRYLGHYVAGNLAQRIGVKVNLSESPTGGVSAKILIPNSVLDAEPAMPGLAPPAKDPLPAQTVSGDDEPMRHEPAALIDGRNGEAASSAPATSDAMAATGRDRSAQTTENGLRRRVRRTEPAAGSATNGRSSGGPVPSEPWPSAAPAAAPVPVDEPVSPTPVRETVPVAPGARHQAAPVAVATPPAEGPPVGAVPEAAPVSEAAPLTKTANGLRKRIPGDQLAASSLAPSIPRGKGAEPVAEGTPPAEPASADSMFSLLSTFESGVQRGRTDLSRTPGTDAPDSETDREV